ncbi:RFT1 family protein [Heterostelium album PN500]|uniref:Protein RFT1 homolog n=1 Tax=Heterostelium pallidum (strain ATCC 26659 / Pp 5 / PN500) TaxID=670386 RepID=D3BUS7_HETP5|nr:RFT1 family protein [Heterostelium album PN500]EFA74865.1 RFT1 family protein [Heterostelium album PN500]|eukprot:XP_020426999.1 RFT1 family protein [Heterostelium album PN500]
MLLFKVRTFVEGSALFLKAVSTYYYVVIKDDGLKGFGYAQIIYSLTLVIGYYGNFIITIYQDTNKQDDKSIQIRSLNQLLPKPIKNDSFISADLYKLTGLYTWQSIQKLLLTEGEKFVLYFSENLTSQAIFSVVSNLGSLIARFFFQPIEESCFSMFPKLFGESTRRQDWSDGSKVLTMLMKLMIIIALIFAAFGPAYSELLLNILYKNKFAESNASNVLGVYCLYVGFMAVNGVSEAFVHSVSKADQLKTLNWILIVIGFIYLTATFILSKLYGTIGIILANCLNMFTRILYSIYFMNQFFKGINEFSIRSMFPKMSVIIIYLLSFVVTNVSRIYFGQNQTSLFAVPTLIHIGIGATCFLVVIISLYFTERSTFRDIKKVLRNKQQ